MSTTPETSTTPGSPCPARLLVPGDRVQIGGAVLDVTAAYVLPGRVECSFMDATTWVISTDVLDPELDVVLVRTATEAVTA